VEATPGGSEAEQQREGAAGVLGPESSSSEEEWKVLGAVKKGTFAGAKCRQRVWEDTRQGEGRVGGGERKNGLSIMSAVHSHVGDEQAPFNQGPRARRVNCFAGAEDRNEAEEEEKVGVNVEGDRQENTV
jgi:hypothetical protein